MAPVTLDQVRRKCLELAPGQSQEFLLDHDLVLGELKDLTLGVNNHRKLREHSVLVKFNRNRRNLRATAYMRR